MYIFIYMNFVIRIHIISRTLLLYVHMLKFTAHLGKKSHFTSGIIITMLLIWYQNAQIFRIFFSQKTRRRSFCFAYGRLETLTSKACHTLKTSHSFIVRRVEKMLIMKIFGILKRLIAKTVL